MIRSAVHVALALAASSVVALSACGDDEAGRVVDAVAGTTYPVSGVCELLPLATVQSTLPGAELDTSLPSPDSCVYTADAGDLIFTVLSPGQGPGRPSPDGLYDLALSDATNNGADDVRDAPSLGDDGKVATNAADTEITAVWRRGDDIYDIQYSGWDGPTGGAITRAKALARAVTPKS